MKDLFWRKNYVQEVVNDVDRLHVIKPSGSDWTQISMTVNDQPAKSITIRSRQQAEQLYFMLKQLLYNNES